MFLSRAPPGRLLYVALSLPGWRFEVLSHRPVSTPPSFCSQSESPRAQAQQPTEEANTAHSKHRMANEAAPVAIIPAPAVSAMPARGTDPVPGQRATNSKGSKERLCLQHQLQYPPIAFIGRNLSSCFLSFFPFPFAFFPFKFRLHYSMAAAAACIIASRPQVQQQFS